MPSQKEVKEFIAHLCARSNYKFDIRMVRVEELGYDLGIVYLESLDTGNTGGMQFNTISTDIAGAQWRHMFAENFYCAINYIDLKHNQKQKGANHAY